MPTDSGSGDGHGWWLAAAAWYGSDGDEPKLRKQQRWRASGDWQTLTSAERGIDSSGSRKGRKREGEEKEKERERKNRAPLDFFLNRCVRRGHA